MNQRHRMVTDVAKHLSDELTIVVMRQLAIMEAGGMRTTDAATAMILAAEQIAFVAIGSYVGHLAPARREVATAEAIKRFASDLQRRSEQLLDVVQMNEFAGAGAGR